MAVGWVDKLPRMKQFLCEDFLLENAFAATLYHQYAASVPIIDYHNHLSPKDIAEDRKFDSLTEAWLEGDHYKWRALRAYGVSESYITGNATDEEKFSKWSEVVPYTVRNPLFHWTHLELQRYFGISELLSPKTSANVYHQCGEQLANASHRCLGLLNQMKVEVLCTTDDPADDLSYHQKIKDGQCTTAVYPTFRPDKLYSIASGEYISYLSKLSENVGFRIQSLDQLLEAAEKRIEFFHAVGGRLSDHGFEQLYDVKYSFTQAKKTFEKVLQGKAPSEQEEHVFKMTVLLELCKLYHKKGWTQQFHLGPVRNNNTRMLRSMGPNKGYDSIWDFCQIKGLSRFLDTLDQADQLPKTILYNLNPRDNETFATMTGNFMDGSIPGKLQYGSGWWFLDQKDGMEKQLNTLSNMGLLSKFIGMLTDSRSFLSFPRHEYFRRILCNLIGKDVENGELPADEEHLGSIVKDICYNNVKKYLDFDN